MKDSYRIRFATAIVTVLVLILIWLLIVLDLKEKREVGEKYPHTYEVYELVTMADLNGYEISGVANDEEYYLTIDISDEKYIMASFNEKHYLDVVNNGVSEGRLEFNEYSDMFDYLMSEL